MSEPTAKTGEEWGVLVDRDDRVIGSAPRGRIRGENLLHRGVAILCRNGKGQIYVHRRTETKDVFPGLYDMFIGGMVARGESYEETARREMAEELGIDAGAPLEFILSCLSEGPRNFAVIHLFQVAWDGPVVHQPEEVAWGRWLDEERLDAWISEVQVVPDGLEVYGLYRRRMARPGPG